MSITQIDRRNFVTRAAWAACAAWALRAGGAAGLSVEENATHESVYRASCEARGAHDPVIKEIVARLESESGPATPESHARAMVLAAAMSCPICGCPLGQAVGDTPPRF